MTQKKLSILGSTGSIGLSTLDVVRAHPDKFTVVALAEGHAPETLFSQIKEFKPKLVSVRDEEAAKQLKSLGAKCEICFGMSGVEQVATIDDADTLVSAIVGSIGLLPTYKAITKGKHIALANKETLVAGGSFVMDAVKKYGSTLLPIDSEHSAILQSMQGHRREDVSRIIITASGGSFRDKKPEELENVTVEDALKHPNWSMGAKITIDSATLVNKALEVIEAHWLFDMPYEQIDAVIHPQSIIHSMVEYKDGSVIAQLGIPDMKLPIAYALSFPEHLGPSFGRLDLCKAGTLTFYVPDMRKFPCFKIALEAGRAGGAMPCMMNAANEVAVDAFLKKQIRFLDIHTVIGKTLSGIKAPKFTSIEDVVETDRLARDAARKVIEKL